MLFRAPTSLWRCGPRTRPPPPLPRARAFISLPGDGPQNLTARRKLPYEPGRLYDLIADVDAYATFLPYCQASRVTRWTEPDSSGRRWPVAADLSIGWGGFQETFSSRLRCVPGSVVEAVSGGDAATEGAVFRSLLTRWTVSAAVESTASTPVSEAELTIKFEFVNPLYSAVTSAMSDKMAGVMIDAFVQQANKVLSKS